jgi:putative acetyltransferase
VEIRIETASDFAGIRRVEEEAFPTQSEADLVDRLRADGDAVLSLVAALENQIVGHIMFSKMRTPTRTLALAPVAVLTPHRRNGIAADLIRAGLKHVQEKGWEAVFVLGNPAYYSRFGFDPALASGFTSPYAGPHLMALALQSHGLRVQKGNLDYPAAFAALT